VSVIATDKRDGSRHEIQPAAKPRIYGVTSEDQFAPDARYESRPEDAKKKFALLADNERRFFSAATHAEAKLIAANPDVTVKEK